MTIKRCGTPVDCCRHLGLVPGVPPAQLAQGGRARCRKASSEVNSRKTAGGSAWRCSSGAIVWSKRSGTRGANQGIDGGLPPDPGNQRATCRGRKYIQYMQKGGGVRRNGGLPDCCSMHITAVSYTHLRAHE